MQKVYRIKDILHTGNKAPYGTRKIGEKYDNRRGKEFSVDIDQYSAGDYLYLMPILFTTPYVKSWEADDGTFYIQTVNSLYICEVIDDGTQ